MRILIVHRELPFPPDNGGRLRAASMAKCLAAYHDTVMLCFSATADVAFPEQALFKQFALVPLPRRTSILRRWCSRSPSEVADLASDEMTSTIARLVQEHDPQVILIREPALTP